LSGEFGIEDGGWGEVAGYEIWLGGGRGGGFAFGAWVEGVIGVIAAAAEPVEEGAGLGTVDENCTGAWAEVGAGEGV